MTELATITTPRVSLVERMADRLHVEPEKLLTCLKGTCFKSERPITNEQLMSLMIVADQYQLNPFTKELFAFDDKRGGIIPYVSYDGWCRIINEQPMYDGADFAWDQEQQSTTCTIYRKDRAHPTVITEYLVECRRSTEPWNKSPRRMLRNRSLMQCGRLAFGFAGIHDEDEAARIRDGSTVGDAPASTQRTRLKQVLQAATQAANAAGTDADVTDIVVVDAGETNQPQGTLVQLMSDLLASGDQDAATEVLDRGRSLLTEDELSELAASYASIWDKE